MTKPLTFLLVDDDSDDASLFQEVLQEAAPSVSYTYAQDGQAALDTLRGADTLPDVIFLDLNMPRMDGKECLGEIKRDAQLSSIPVIMFTTSSQSRDIEDTMMHGAICFITKPSSMNELKHILSTIASSLPNHLGPALRDLSNNAQTFIVC